MNLHLNVAAASVNQVPLDWAGNRDRLAEAIAASREAGAALICLPELSITGYGCEDMFLAPAVGEAAWGVLEELRPHSAGLVVAVGLPVWFQSSVFNAVALLVDGSIAGVVCKQNLAGDGVHYEPRWFKPWPEGETDVLHVGEDTIPLGDLVFEIDGVRIGFEICEDAWIAERPGVRLSRRGVDVILNPSASHFAFGKQEIRRRFVLEGSRAFACSYIYANLLGNESGRIIFDGGTSIASGGAMVATGPRFSYRDVNVTTCPIDIGVSRMHRARQVSHVPLMGDLPGSPLPRNPGILNRPDYAPCTVTREEPPFSKEEEFGHAVALGLFDYLRKSRSGGFVVSLSGGADSGAVATLVKVMVDLALDELGESGFRERLGHIPFDDASPMVTLLTCVYQATKNSGEITRRAAGELARSIGAHYLEWDIEDIVAGYRATVEKSVGRPLTWESDDVTLQNIQSRSRSPGIWMMAKLENNLLLATCNRSEAAVGYATMDGDTSGGLSPLCGIDKAFLRHWLRWVEKQGGRGIAPLSSLRWINDQEPTAELRPREENQTDEGDLMPYPILDGIERHAIRDKKLPVEVFHLLEASWSGTYPRDQLRDWVIRFFQLWSRNQWKRERYAPSFHLDDENLDPRTWCRFPILSSGFAAELEALRKL